MTHLEIRQFFVSKKDTTNIGTLPVPLQQLFLLSLTLDEEFSAEVHRRCVEMFGSEEYDHEGMEYYIHCQVDNDPLFNQSRNVWNMLERRIRKLWQKELTTPAGHEIIFYVDENFAVLKTKFRRQTDEELLAKIEAISRAVSEQLS